VSILLLAFGLIASMANVLTKGAVLSDNIIMQRVWAITQCCGIDASLAGTIIRTFQYHAQGERVKMFLYAFLSVLLLFTAAIVLNIESVQQALNLTLHAAYLHVFVPIEALIWIRSIAIVLLIVAHALRHVQIVRPQEEPPAPAQVIEQPQFVLTPEMIDQLRQLLMPTTVEEEVHQQVLPSPKETQTETIPPEDARNEEKLEVNNRERVKSYLAEHPRATLHEIAGALTISVTTANKWRTRILAECTQGKRKKARSA